MSSRMVTSGRCLSGARATCIMRNSHSRAFSGEVDHSTYIPVKFEGRQSVSGITATVFGATGFMGRYVVSRLGRIGSQVLVPYRGDGMNTRHMKLMGDLGQIQPVPINMVDEETIKQAVRKSNVVINLMGSEVSTRNYSVHDANVKCVHRIAKAAAESGVCKRFIHVSALGASMDSPSAYLRSKAEGESVVKDFFPKATIMRPAPMFGLESRLLHSIAQQIRATYHVALVEGGVKGTLSPVHVHDVAQAIVNAIVSSDAPGETYTLAGPNTYTRAELFRMVGDGMMMDDFTIVPLPENIAKTVGGLIEKFAPYDSWKAYNTDSAIMNCMDLVAPSGSKGLQDLRVEPVTLESRMAWCMMDYTSTRDDYQFGKLSRGHYNAQEKIISDSRSHVAGHISEPRAC